MGIEEVFCGFWNQVEKQAQEQAWERVSGKVWGRVMEQVEIKIESFQAYWQTKEHIKRREVRWI